MLPRSLIGPILVVFVLLNVAGQVLPLYTDYLWFQEVKLVSVFTTILGLKLLLGIAGGLLVALFLYLNVWLAARPTSGDVLVELEDPLGLPSRLVIEPLVRKFLLPGALVLGFLAAMQAASEWETVLRFLNAQPFNAVDPLFGRDIGFYVFRLPLLEALYGWAMFLLGATLLLVLATYVLHRGVQITPQGPRVATRARTHLLTLGALLLVVKAGGYYLDTFSLLTSVRGIVSGAGFSDIHATLPALRILAILALISAAVCIWQIGRQGFRVVLVALGVLLVANVLGLGVIPNVMQRLRVVPNEMVAERPYIEQNIKYTRMAYGLDRIKEEEFPAEETLRAEDLRKNDATIKNIRLWDRRPLLVTYAQLQEIRTYYKFVDVDNDRYMVDGAAPPGHALGSRVVLPEPSQPDLDQRAAHLHPWVRGRHGPRQPDHTRGAPRLLDQGHSPRLHGADQGHSARDLLRRDRQRCRRRLRLRQDPGAGAGLPRRRQERLHLLHRPGGRAGPVGFRKLLFALRFGDVKILLSNDIIGESRVMYYREIERAGEEGRPLHPVRPDPYLVIGAGRPPVLDHRRLHHQRQVPLLRAGPRAGQLHPELGQGRGGCLQRQPGLST